MAEIDPEIKQLRDEVQRLRIATLDRERPWYRQPSTIVSLVAVLVSIGTAIFTGLETSEKDVRSKKEELRTVLATLIDLERQRVDRGNQSVSVSERESLTQKRLIALDAAEFIAKKIPKEVSPYEYLYIADQKALEGNYDKAERYYMSAVNASHDDLSRIISLRLIAMFYFGIPDRHRNIEKARDSFRKATEIFKEPGDPYSTYQVAITYVTWASFELYTKGGSEGEGKEKLETGKGYWTTLKGRKRLELEEWDRRLREP